MGSGFEPRPIIKGESSAEISGRGGGSQNAGGGDSVFCLSDWQKKKKSGQKPENGINGNTRRREKDVAVIRAGGRLR